MTYQIISERKLRRTVKIEHPSQVYMLVRQYAAAKQEYFILLTLDSAHIVISVSIITIGLVNRTLVHQREVFSKAISDRATAIIICHNHTSDSVAPSDEDKAITEKIYNAGELIGIPRIDHVIFSKKAFVSLRQLEVMPKG